jgi:hypothetical protein
MRGVALALACAVAALAAAAGCRTARPGAGTAAAPEPIGSWLAASPELASFARRASELRVQIVVGTLEAGPEGRPVLRQTGFRAGAEYFYPASSIKTFAAVAALELLAELRAATGLPIDRDTPLAYHPLFAGETLETADPTHLAGGTITVGHEVRKLAIVSDNESFNKLYELVGQDGLARSLARAGLTGPRLVHRLSESRSAEENRRVPRIDFRGEGFSYTMPERSSAPLEPPPPMPGLLVGSAYVSGETRVEEAMDFAGKNRMSLADLQRGLCKLVRPDADCGGGPPFALTDDDRAFLVGAMTEYPRESADPRFDTAEYPDHWGKNLLPGLTRVLPQERWRIVNKTGRAYGFSIDNAWVEDRVAGRGMFVAATIYTNADGVLNDDRYDYETVADPFFAALGEAVARALAAPSRDKERPAVVRDGAPL